MQPLLPPADGFIFLHLSTFVVVTVYLCASFSPPYYFFLPLSSLPHFIVLPTYFSSPSSPHLSLSLTFRYVAPEILLGEPYGTEVDIWSMGVICYVLLAGYPPFYDEDQKKLFKKIKEGKYHFHQDYWCNTSPDAMDMIKKMLCVNQVDR